MNAGALLFGVELALFSTALCALYALRGRIGIAPLYGVIGLLEAFLFVAGQASAPISATMLTGTANVSSLMFVPLLLVVGVLLYTLEGTNAARWYIVAIIALYAM